MDGQNDRLNIIIISNLLEDDLAPPQIWLMHHMPAIKIKRSHFVLFCKLYRAGGGVKTEREHVSNQKFTLLCTDLRVGVFHYGKQIHYIIFCKCWVFPTFKIILPQQDLDTFKEKKPQIIKLNFNVHQ